SPGVRLMLWNGLSSLGAFFGALVRFFWYLRKITRPCLIYAGMLVFRLVVGFTMGRLRSSPVHDHPGAIVGPCRPLAGAPWPGGEYRFDNGLLEFMYLVPIVLFVHFVFGWAKSAPGRIAGLVCLLYAPFRFALDFMREKDKTYLGLTTAHYATMIL